MRAASLNLYLMRGATRLGVPRAFIPHDERRGFPLARSIYCTALGSRGCLAPLFQQTAFNGICS